jgi:polygalacturonase
MMSVIDAVTPNTSDVDAAIALAHDGDTVRIPEGTAEWFGQEHA